jgi:hypothetical protein
MHRAEAADDDVGLLEAAFLLPFWETCLQKVAPFVLRQKAGAIEVIASRNAVLLQDADCRGLNRSENDMV